MIARRVLHLGWGLLIGGLIGACGLVWIELHDVWVGVARSAGIALIVIAVCSPPEESRVSSRA